LYIQIPASLIIAPQEIIKKMSKVCD